MRKLIKKQNGLTAIGIMFILAMIAGVVLIALRIFPLYNEKFQIISAMNNTVLRPEASSFSQKKAGKAFMKSLSVTNINRFNRNNLKEHLKVIKPKKKGEPRILHLQYEARNKFFADIHFLLVFDKKLPLTGPSADG